MLEIPENSTLYLKNVAILEVSACKPDKTIEDFITEIEDAINILQGRASLWQICYEAFKKYLLHDSNENFEELSRTYYALPSHKRRVLDSTENKDPVIALMTGKVTGFTPERRKHMLNDYYDDEWSEEDFR